jgi:hypothetical protein
MKTKYDPEKMRVRIKQALYDQRLSMRAASLEAGLSGTFVHGIVELGRQPRVDTLARLCDRLGLSLSYVMYGLEVSPELEDVLLLIQSHPEKVNAIRELLSE